MTLKHQAPAIAGHRTRWVLLVLLLSNASQAQYQMQRHSLNAGGGEASAGAYRLHGSLAQADAGEQLSGGTYTLNGGFWQRNSDLIFTNGFE